MGGAENGCGGCYQNSRKRSSPEPNEPPQLENIPIPELEDAPINIEWGLEFFLLLATSIIMPEKKHKVYYKLETPLPELPHVVMEKISHHYCNLT
jgi:hypothetical protein